MEKDVCLIIVDGGCRNNGTPDAQSYGSAKFISPGWTETVRWDDLPRAQTNNEAEYDALIKALEFCDSAYHHRSAAEFPVLRIQMDSQLVIQQVRGLWRVNKEALAERRARVRELLGRFPAAEFELISGVEMKKILGH